MKCYLCKLEVEQTTTTYTAKINEGYAIIENVPCKKCPRCGEEYLDLDILKKIEKIIAGMNAKMKEVKVLDFEKAA